MLLVVTFSPQTNAQITGYWRITAMTVACNSGGTKPAFSIRYSSPGEACTAAYSCFPGSPSIGPLGTGNTRSCGSTPNTWNPGTSIALTTCTVGTYYTPSTQQCQPPPSSCPAGQSLNPTANICEPISCTPPQVINPHLGVCDDPPPECPPLQEWNWESQQCVYYQNPACPDGTNPVTRECETCESGNYWAGESGGPYGNVYGSCLPTPGECSAAGGTIYNDETTTNIASPSGNSSSQKMVYCAPDPGPCQNVTGKVQTATSQSFDYCKERADQCASQGGTYGSVGASGNYAHVCLLNAGQSVPTCASGSQLHYKEYGPDSFGFACTPATPPNDVCDAQKYDCDNDGFVDDQDENGCVDNGTLNDFDNCVASNGTGTNPGGSGSGSPGGFDGPNVGDDPLDPAVDGAGDCDPTSQNYQECISKGSPLAGIAEAVSGNGTEIINPYSVSSDVQDSTDEYTSALADAPIVSAVSGWSGAFSGAGECPSPSFQVFGTDFTLDYHCTLYELIEGPLSLVMLSVWLIAGGRHLMSA